MTRSRPAFRVNRRLSDVIVCPGPLLLSHPEVPDLASHQRHFGTLPRLGRQELQTLCQEVNLVGRGGAGFPLAQKLAAISGRSPVVVLNGTETEPGSAKDAVLLTQATHLVLDGVALAAQALRCQEVHLVVPGTAEISAPVTEAVRQRQQSGERIPWRVHPASDRFVGGQSSAVLELLAGREDIPAATWTPAAQKGLAGRPTLLSNVETFAQLAALARTGAQAYTALGYPGHPGTAMITVDSDSPEPYVAEIPGGTCLADAIAPRWAGNTPVLVGGFHGSWVPAEAVPATRLSHSGVSPPLAAGVLLPMRPDVCPVRYTEYALRFLASESAEQCGPCRLGLPALSQAMQDLHSGAGPAREVARLATMVTGRGLCAHPDGTAALAESLLQAFPAEIAQHERGGCGWAATA